MFSLFTYGLISVLSGLFMCMDGHHTVKNIIQIKYHKFRRLNKFVSSNYKGCVNILCISLCMIIQALWITLWQHLNNSVVKLKNNKYEVSYVIKGIKYKMIVQPKRGPRKILMVVDNEQSDVSDIIFPYLGPEEDFHGKLYTPKVFNKEELIFELSNGDEKIFGKDEVILIS